MSDDNDDSVDVNEIEGVIDISDRSPHIDNLQVNGWLKADDNEFRPTHQQEKFRELAYKMARYKKFFRGEWYKATKKKEYSGVPINERTWNRWCTEDEKFRAWFYDEFPETSELSEEEFRMMDMQYWTGVRDAMGDGEEWAYRQYAKTRFDSAAAKKDQAESESLLELRNYFSTGGGDGWTSKPGEA
jgi:hypothetical protein